LSCLAPWRETVFPSTNLKLTHYPLQIRENIKLLTSLPPPTPFETPTTCP